MILQILIGAVIGAGFGFGWHRFVGCATGACPLTSNRFVTTLYGMAAGALFAAGFP